MNISSVSEIIKPTFKGRLRRARKQLSYLTTPTGIKSLRNPYLNSDTCGDAHESDECDSSRLREQVIRSHIEDKLANFMLEKDLHAKGLGEMLYKKRNEMHNHFSQILTTLGKSKTLIPEPTTPTLAIITRSGITTRDPPNPSQPSSTPIDNTVERDKPNNEETPATRNHENFQSPTLYHPSKSSSVPFPSWLKKQKKDEEDERLLSIFRKIDINFPFLEAMIHMPK
ncbi:hypothetical protein Tco_1049236 [Tanacetum coccineum]